MRRSLLRHLWLQTLLWGALVVGLNHLSSALFARFDLTSDQRHSLSTVAREAVGELERPLLVRVWFSDGLAAPYHDHRRALLDKLAELQAAAGGRLEVEAIDPTGDPVAVAAAARDGVRPIPYAFRAWDRTESRTVFMGAALSYGERRVAIDALPAIDTMEAELIRAIHRVTRKPEDAPQIGWLLGHGEPDPTAAPEGSPLVALAQRLSERGGFRTVAPGSGPIPEELDVLFVVAPSAGLTAEETAQLDRFLVGGGRVLLWLSTAVPDFASGAPRSVDAGLGAWLGHHGVRVGRDLVVDRDHTEPMVVPMEVEGLGRQLVRLNYPLAVTTTNLDRTVRAVRDLERVVVPFVSTLAVQERTDVDARTWVRTMPGSVAVRALDTLDPRALREPLDGEQAGAWPVVVALAGRFAPVDPNADVRRAPTRLLVVSSGDAVANNPELVLNAVDWAVDDDSLIGLRGRGVGEPPMPAPTGAVALRWKLAAVGGPWLLLGLLAAGVAARRST